MSIKQACRGSVFISLVFNSSHARHAGRRITCLFKTIWFPLKISCGLGPRPWQCWWWILRWCSCFFLMNAWSEFNNWIWTIIIANNVYVDSFWLIYIFMYNPSRSEFSLNLLLTLIWSEFSSNLWRWNLFLCFHCFIIN